MTQQDATKILDAIIESSSSKLKNLSENEKILFVSDEILEALKSCTDWRKPKELKFLSSKVFYKGIEIK